MLFFSFMFASPVKSPAYSCQTMSALYKPISCSLARTGKKEIINFNAKKFDVLLKLEDNCKQIKIIRHPYEDSNLVLIFDGKKKKVTNFFGKKLEQDPSIHSVLFLSRQKEQTSIDLKVFSINRQKTFNFVLTKYSAKLTVFASLQEGLEKKQLFCKFVPLVNMKKN